MKRVLASLLLTAALVVGAGPAQAKSYSFSRVDIEAWVERDGSMRVAETRAFDFSGSFHHAYRTIDLPAGTAVAEFEVAEPDRAYTVSNSQEPGTFFVSRSDSTFRADWYYSAQDEVKTFVLRYRIAGAAVKHADFAELYWQFIGKEWDVPSKHVKVVVHLPVSADASAVGNTIRAWAHGPLWGGVKIEPGSVRSDVVLACDNLPPRQMWEGRILFPAEVIGEGAREESDAILPAALEEEERWARDANLERLGARLKLIPFLGFPIFALAGWLWLYFRFGKEYEPTFQGDYYRDPPDNCTPAQLGMLWNWGVLGPRDMAATLMDLVRRGAVKISSQTQMRPRLGGLLGTAIEQETSLVRIPNPETPIRPSEKYLLDFIFAPPRAAGSYIPPTIEQVRDAIAGRQEPGSAAPQSEATSGDLSVVTLDDIKERAKAEPATFRSYFQTWKGFAAAESRTHFLDPSSPRGQAFGIGLGALLFILTFPGFMLFPHPAVMLYAFGGMAMIIASLVILRRRNPQAAESLAKWQAFRRYLNDFSQISNMPAPAVAVWEQYLVYAITLGVADKVIEQFRMHYPEAVATAGGTTAFSDWFADGRGLDGLQALDSVMSTVESTIATATSASSSGSGGGGGSSGGGGDGGGGGGGGAN